MKLFDFTNMTLEIQGYGYEYSIKKFITQLLLSYLLIIVAGTFFQLPIVSIIILCVWAFICLPIIVLAQFRYLANNKKFEILVGYLEQMIFAFKKSPKILECFHLTLPIVDKRMQKHVIQAIEIIENDTSGNAYQEAFMMIEKEFPCTRIKALHKFMISIEENGGKYQKSIDILLEDIQAWVSRTYEYQKDLKGIKGKIMLSIMLSIAIAGTMMAIIPKELIVFGKSPIYIVSTTLLFVFLIALIAFIQSKLNGKWLIDDTIETSDRKIIKARKVLKHANQDNKIIDYIALCIPLPILLLGIILQNRLTILGSIIFILYLYFRKQLMVKHAKRIIKKGLEKEFPLWLRDISVQLQTLVVPLAIKSSIPNAALVLQPYLYKMIEQIDIQPTSIEPYTYFLQEFHLTDVSNAMKILYTIQTLDMIDAKEQIDDLVKRNQKMLAKSEQLKNEDILAGIGFIVAFPMLLATLKLIVDLILVLAQFMNMSSGVL